MKDTPQPVVNRDPLTRSALVMAGAKVLAAHPVRVGGRERDGMLTALEVVSMDLEGTELVVLSACETGIGQSSARSGVYGLRRSFFTAGVQTLVTSLWPVSDRATQDLMTDYYERLKRGAGRVTAMHEAMVELRRKRPHPYYWAPFVVLGSGAPLSAQPR
jgi:CHAT domain-containing protein